MRLSDERSKVTETSTGSESAHLDHGHDARLAIHVPGWSGPMRQKPRSENWGQGCDHYKHVISRLLMWVGWEA